MTTYMLVDTSPEALPRGVYDSAKDVAAALGVTVDSIYHPENKRGNDRIYRMGREKVRLIRRFFPKGKSFTSVSEETISLVEGWINNLPRKFLHYLSPDEVFHSGERAPGK